MNYWYLTIFTILALFISHKVYFEFVEKTIKPYSIKWIAFSVINFQLAFLLPIYLNAMDSQSMTFGMDSQLFSLNAMIWFFTGCLVSGFYIFNVRKESKELNDMLFLDSIFYIIMQEMIMIFFWPIILIISIFYFKKV